MSRPKKQTDQTRSHTVRARVTPDERTSIEQQAANAGLSLTEYVRRRVLGHRINPRPARVDFELVNQLRKIGVNLNQQTRRLHETGQVPDELRRLWGKFERLTDILFDELDD